MGGRSGKLLGIPYDFSRLTGERLRRGAWDPDNPKVLVPKAWGWGYGINLHAVARRITGRR
jgi:hypothetical protein